MTLPDTNAAHVHDADQLAPDRAFGAQPDPWRKRRPGCGGLSPPMANIAVQAPQETRWPIVQAERRIQRREFKDYQALFMLINSLDCIDEATRREFSCINGPVWQRFNEACKGTNNRRITALFLGGSNNGFDELLLVACSFVKRRQHHSVCLWNNDQLADGPDEAAVRHICHDLAGRSVLTLQTLQPWLRPNPTEDFCTTGADPGGQHAMPGHPGLMPAARPDVSQGPEQAS